MDHITRITYRCWPHDGQVVVTIPDSCRIRFCHPSVDNDWQCDRLSTDSDLWSYLYHYRLICATFLCVFSEWNGGYNVDGVYLCGVVKMRGKWSDWFLLVSHKKK